MKTKPTLLSLLALIGLLALHTIASPIPDVITAAPNLTDPPTLLLRVTTNNADDVHRLTNGAWDVLEARQGNALFVLGNEAVAAKLRVQGFVVAVEETLPTQSFNRTDAAGTFFGGYRTIAEHYAHLDTLAANQPDLAKVIDYGDSWRKVNGKANGHDLKAICITKLRPNSNDCALNPNTDKPRFLLMAAIHARELSTSEMAWRWMDYLIDNYNKDADVTQLLEQNEFWVIPIVNPDGRQIVEQGSVSPYLQRKNANTTLGNCPTPPESNYHSGVDLNRNASFQWNVAGTDPNPCYATYPGTSAASEPEQAALEALLKSLFRDQRGPQFSDAAPNTTSGVLLTLHSYSDLILLPWGSFECNGTACPANKQAPNEAGLRSLAFRMSYFNDYVTGQPSEVLYAASGTTDDWAYGTLGIAAFTFEIGPFASPSGCGSFTPFFACQDRFWGLNKPAFIYAAKVAQQPYTLSLGPSVISPSLNITTAIAGQAITLSANVSDEVYGNHGFARPATQAIARVEYTIDTPFGVDGAVIGAMSASDGLFNSPYESVVATFAAPPNENRHTIYLRGCDASGNCGPSSAIWLNVINGKRFYLPNIWK